MSQPHPNYETEAVLGEYLLFHYGQPEEVMPYPFGPRDAVDFPARIVRECLQTLELPRSARALDVGCAVGRSSFELARHCTDVLGIDFSEAFIKAAMHLQKRGLHDFTYLREGHIRQRGVAAVPEGIERQRVRFEQGDACNLRPDLEAFDVVLAANLICRLPRPMAFLERLPAIVKPGGQLVLSTPFTWTEAYTPVEHWLGGTPETGDSFNALKRALEPHFTLRQTFSMPFVIREHIRKFQWIVTQVSCWERVQ